MTDIDIEALRAAAEKSCAAIVGPDITAAQEAWEEFRVRALPSIVIALFDRLAAAEAERDRLLRVAEAARASYDARQDEARQQILFAQAKAAGAPECAEIGRRAIDALWRAQKADDELRAALDAKEPTT